MAYSPIAFIAPNYSDYGTYWLKAYSPGSTSPKTLSVDPAATTLFSKLQLNVDGFFKSAGGALITPHIEGSYDAYLFQTAAEAEANNTATAIRVADNITPVTTTGAIAFTITTTELIASSATFTASTVINTSGYTTSGDGGKKGWKQNGVTGQTVSQSPAQLLDGLLNDGSGNQWALVKDGYTKAESLGLIGDGSTDDLAVCKACLAVGITEFPAKIIALSDELVIPVGSGIIGFNCFWKRRTTYVYTAGVNTVFTYIGSAGANTAVIRASRYAVGTTGLDLTDVIMRNFHIDAGGLADFGLYIYRVGNQSNVGNITAEKAVVANHCHIGSYASDFGVFGSYEAVGEGCSIGVDLFGIGTVESTNFEYKATFLTANNGTGNTYVKGSATDLENSGGTFKVGRGSVVYIRSESNFGRACVLGQYKIGGGTAGPTDYELSYVEANNDGPFLASQPSTDGMRILNGFIHPGNGSTLLSQDITIEAQDDAGTPVANGGPSLTSEWPVLERLSGNLAGVGFAVKSNTTKFAVRDCAEVTTYPNSKPAVNFSYYSNNTTINNYSVQAHGSFNASSGTLITQEAVNCTLNRISDGLYEVTFVTAMDNAFYTVVCPAENINRVVSIDAKSTTAFRINNVSTSAVYSDGGAIFEFAVIGKRTA
jgi:hypothetical protein